MKVLLFVLSVLLMSLVDGVAADMPKDHKESRTITIDIPADLPPPASAEEVAPLHPFFADSPANEDMEKIQELEERIEKLEKRVSLLEKGTTK